MAKKVSKTATLASPPLDDAVPSSLNEQVQNLFEAHAVGRHLTRDELNLVAISDWSASLKMWERQYRKKYNIPIR